MKFYRKHVLIGIILLLALGLKFYNYEFFPVAGETQDESAWAFLGASLIQTGQPTSWSFFRPYEEGGYIFLSRDIPGRSDIKEAPFVRPDLDQPPLFSLIPGSFHSFRNHWQEFPSVRLTRFPMVFLGVLNVFLLFLLAKKYFKDEIWAYLAALIYATVPSFVFASRLVVSENLMATWTLLALLLLQSRQIKFRLVFLVLISILAILTKVSGVVVPLAIIFSGLSSDDARTTKAGLIGLVSGIVAFIGYGSLYNLKLFFDVLLGQAGRDIGLLTLQNRLLLHPSIVAKVFFDGWIIFGLISSIWLVLKNDKKFLALNIFVVLNLFFILATAGEQTVHGWYDYMLYPLFVIAITQAFKNIFMERNYLMFGAVWILLLPVIRMALTYGGVYSDLSPFILRVIMGFGLVPFLLSLLFKNKQIFATRAMMIFLALIILANIGVIFTVTEVNYWELEAVFKNL